MRRSLFYSTMSVGHMNSILTSSAERFLRPPSGPLKFFGPTEVPRAPLRPSGFDEDLCALSLWALLPRLRLCGPLRGPFETIGPCGLPLSSSIRMESYMCYSPLNCGPVNAISTSSVSQLERVVSTSTSEQRTNRTLSYNNLDIPRLA